jgi:hypothetical protein
MADLTKREREQRDEAVIRLFLAGESYRAIGAAVGMRSASGVHRIVQRELAAGARRRGVLTEDAFDVWQERSERLFQAHWERALEGDHRSAELCRKLLAQQVRVYGLGVDADPLPPSTLTVDIDDDAQDELSKLRAARTGR